MLRKTTVPSVLVECGFLTNPTEAQLALQSSYRDRLADRIAAGVEGRATPFNRPVVAGITHVSSSYNGGYNDFVSSNVERPAIKHHSPPQPIHEAEQSEKQPQKQLENEEEKLEQQQEEEKEKAEQRLARAAFSLTNSLHAPIITPGQMRAAEEAAFARGVPAAALMEIAGTGIARAVRKFFPGPGKCVVFAGKGHNAGDAFVAARRLAEAGWEIETRLAYPEGELSSLTSEKLAALRTVEPVRPHDGPTIFLDGLLGLGAQPPLREPVRSLCRELNAWGRGARVVAIDLPSGLDGATGAADDDCVRADFTFTIGFAKSGLVADDALDFVGRLEVIPLDDLRVADTEQAAELATPEVLRELRPRRPYSAYKNQFGRIGMVAGSRGFTGAALLCSLGALRAGAGLVELFVPEEIYEVIATAAAPEVMVKPVADYGKLLEEKIDVWAVGPGLGKAHATEILRLIREAKQPMVVDADGLNILADHIATRLGNRRSAPAHAASGRDETPLPHGEKIPRGVGDKVLRKIRRDPPAERESHDRSRARRVAQLQHDRHARHGDGRNGRRPHRRLRRPARGEARAARRRAVRLMGLRPRRRTRSQPGRSK